MKRPADFIHDADPQSQDHSFQTNSCRSAADAAPVVVVGSAVRWLVGLVITGDGGSAIVPRPGHRLVSASARWRFPEEWHGTGARWHAEGLSKVVPSTISRLASRTTEPSMYYAADCAVAR